MPKRQLPAIPGAYMVPEVKLSADHRAAILETLPLTNTNEADAAIAEVEEILGEFQADVEREPKVKEAVAELESLADAASQTFGAIGALGITAQLLVLEQAQEALSITDLRDVSRSSLWLSSWAQRAADEIRPGGGRPVAWPARMALAQLAGLWERRTGTKAAWFNRENDGGPFCRFAEAVSRDFSSTSSTTTSSGAPSTSAKAACWARKLASSPPIPVCDMW